MEDGATANTLAAGGRTTAATAAGVIAAPDPAPRPAFGTTRVNA
ncbi:hypothetical protein GCM10010347_48730 [Streptomyces cirratus]|uniref:Uncharacterized protein n=1 Tax=Streptomyces cirratus TaxID=68187 RepID=A0ABQ3F2K7_9ACTN|nr:hypothetical protein [Streptomyces cirratus]GHB72665.1 hypothetical protein GCM10010347_48730 [Streptomyces cirratus]